MINIFTIFLEIFNNFYFLFTIEFIAFFLKACLLILTILHGLRAKKIQKSWFFLLLVLIGNMFSDAAWVISLARTLFFPFLDQRITFFVIRIAWAWHIIQYQALDLFLQSLINKSYSISLRKKFLILTSSTFCLFFIYLAFFKFQSINPRPSFEFELLRITEMYVFLIMIPGLYTAFRAIRKRLLPKILRQQLKILIQAFIAPSLLFDFFQFYPFAFVPGFIASNYAVVSISTILLTFAFYFAARKMIGLRFLNLQSHVQSPTKFNFIDDFKDVLEQLSHVTSTKELGHIAQLLFKAAFSIQPSRVTLHLRKLEAGQQAVHEGEQESETNSMESVVEGFISRHDDEATCDIARLLRQNKILITDELAFSNFYDETDETKALLQFLEHIHADIFIPIFEKQTIIAYIIVERDARPGEFYSNIERDEMVVFASYLGNIINLLQNRNLNALIQQEKELREELYSKHQEINQYKESIRSFLHNQQRKIGILFYKNRRFTFGNQAAQELIEINPNTQEGHPLARALKQLTHKVQDYKTGQTMVAKDSQGTKLVLSAIPNLEENNIIIMVYYPEIADIIKTQLDQVKNPTECDYLLYLETTSSGKLINQLIPGTGAHLVQFKIELLKIALGKKALLLDIPEEDVTPTVEILHHISLRETLHILTLQAQEKNYETAIKLFGINPILTTQQEPALLEKLHNGTLFIKNIHFLDLETQNNLAEFIRYGYFHVFKSDQKIASSVRVICSTNQNLATLTQADKFSKALFNELKQTTLSMPSLITLPEDELNALAEGFTEQAIRSQQAFKNLLELTDKEKDKLIHARPVSLQEFKTKVQNLLLNKSKKNHISQEVQFDPAYNVSDPELVQAARLGKKALKDPKIMALLWYKFGSQNKIASFLGVNRSSVNRRCKEYNLAP